MSCSTPKEPAVTADTLRRAPARHSPLEAYAERFADSPLDLAEEPFVTQLVLRIDPHSAAATAVEERLGLPLPVANAASNPAGPRSVVWLGPDEWLITDADGPTDLEAGLAEIVRPADGAVVDVSAQRTTIRLRGPHARAVLAKGCAVDLHPRVVRHQLAQQTMLAHAGVILVVLDAGRGGAGPGRRPRRPAAGPLHLRGLPGRMAARRRPGVRRLTSPLRGSEQGGADGRLEAVDVTSGELSRRARRRRR